MKIRLVGTEFFHADGRIHGQTDITKQIVALSNLVNTTKKIRGQNLCLSSV
jgi:hypothetical protein